ncbi:MAG: ISAs1 family transposase, partial [Oligoflexia bacterium]|nr:ISAs1 family transposase [Oligoflexia bacterium]
PDKFQVAFLNWVNSLIKLKEGDTISLDGKYFKASQSKSDGPVSLIGVINAYLTEGGVAMAVKKADFKKEGEKKVFKDMIEILNLSGVTVTIDANGSFADITNRILEKGGNYVVPLKDNQKTMHRLASDLFTKELKEKSECDSIEKDHGRIETRKCTAIPVPEEFVKLLCRRKNQRIRDRGKEEWKEINSLVQIINEREINGKITKDIRTYVSSLKPNATKLSQIIRSHWKIENKLHYALDVSFDEDRSRSKKGFGAENFAIIRRLVINLLNKDASKKSIQVKRLRASLDLNYLIKIIFGAQEKDLVQKV